MRIGLVGEFATHRDEGLKNLALDLRDSLAVDHEVVTFDLTRVGSQREWRAFAAARPGVVHYVPGNTPRSLVVAAAIARRADAPHLLSCPHPRFSWVYRQAPAAARLVARLFPPARVLVPSSAAKRHFEEAGVPSEFLPQGINTDRFSPATAAGKAGLREELGLPQDRHVVLHVGHLRRVRNLGVMAELARRGHHAVVLASEYLPEDPGVRAELLAAGVDVRVGFEPRVERYYRASDLYVFPCPLDHTLAAPLSVLEALACGIAVVTRPFEGLVDLYPSPPPALTFVEDDRALVEVAEARLADPHAASEARSLGERTSLRAVTRRLHRVYEEVGRR